MRRWPVAAIAVLTLMMFWGNGGMAGASADIRGVVSIRSKTSVKEKPFVRVWLDDLFCSDDPQEALQWSTDRLSKVSFSRIARVDFVDPTDAEWRLLKTNPGCADPSPDRVGYPYPNCHIRKANISLRNDTMLKNVFCNVSPVTLYGPEDQRYILSAWDVVGIVLK